MINNIFLDLENIPVATYNLTIAFCDNIFLICLYYYVIKHNDVKKDFLQADILEHDLLLVSKSMQLFGEEMVLLSAV